MQLQQCMCFGCVCNRMEHECRKLVRQLHRTVRHLGYWHVLHVVVLVVAILLSSLWTQEPKPNPQPEIHVSSSSISTGHTPKDHTRSTTDRPDEIHRASSNILDNVGASHHRPDKIHVAAGITTGSGLPLLYRQIMSAVASRVKEVREGTERLFLYQTARLILFRDVCRRSDTKLPIHGRQNRFQLSDFLPTTTKEGYIKDSAETGSLLKVYLERLAKAKALLQTEVHGKKEVLSRLLERVHNANKDLAQESERNSTKWSSLVVEFTPENWCDFIKCRHSIAESWEQALFNMEWKLADLRKERDNLKDQIAKNAKSINERITEKEAEVSQLKQTLQGISKKKEEVAVKCKLLHKNEDCEMYKSLNKLESELDQKIAEEVYKVDLLTDRGENIEYDSEAKYKEMKDLEKDIQQMKSKQPLPEDSTDAGHGPELIYTGQEYIYPFQFSSKAWNEPMTVPKWKVSMGSDSDESLRQVFDEITQQLNSAMREVEVSALLVRIDMKRQWLNTQLLKDVDSAMMQPSQSKPTSLSSLPPYPSSLLLVTDIRISLKGLIDLSSLFHLAYEQRVTGSFGPFSFGHMFETEGKRVKFRVARETDGSVTLTFPGTQHIGYFYKQ